MPCSLRASAAGDLQTNWRRREGLCRPFADSWLLGRSTALLSAPSAIVDAEPNSLLTPRHPDAPRANVAELVPFPWDERLFSEPPMRHSIFLTAEKVPDTFSLHETNGSFQSLR